MINKIAGQFLDVCVSELQREDKKQKIRKEILDPMIEYIGEKLWPYVLTTVLVIISMLLLLSYTTFRVVRLS
jgi:hypothetical protein